MNSLDIMNGTKGDTSKMEKPIAASTLNKVLAFGLASTLVVWTFGVFLALPAQAVDQHPNGTLVVSGTTVYKVMDGQRWGFPSANVFMSQGHSWSQVVPANSADAALPQGANLGFADGTLVNDGGTIFIIAGGQKLGFTSGSVFTGLGYKFANVINDSLASYPQGANVSDTAMAHPAGTLVNYNGTIWLVTSTGRSGIPSPGVFYSWGLDFADVVPANAADLALTVAANAGYRVGSLVNDGGTIFAVTSATAKQGFPSASCFTDFGFMWSSVVSGSTAGLTAGANLCTGSTPTPSPTPTTPSSTGTLSVSRASDTPVSGIAIQGASRVPFTKIMLSASGGDVVIDSWVVQRMGVGNDSDFASVDIVDVATNATINESGKTFNTDHQATFSEDFVIPSGSSKYVMLAGNMAAAIGSGNQPALGLTAITLKGGTVNASLPIIGNSMTTNNAITIGTAVISRGAYTNASTTVEVGKKDYNYLSFQIAAGSAEDVGFSQVKVYQQGSASLPNDMANLKLYRDGTFLANGTVSGNYVNFSFPEQVIPKGQTFQYVVRADVLSGSARTIKLGIWRTTDIYTVGKTFNTGITPTYSGTGVSSTGNPSLSDNEFTISTGTLRVSRSTTVGAGNIAVGNDQVLSAFEFEAKGEGVVVTALTITISTSTASAAATADALRSIKIVNSAGSTVAGPKDRANGGASAAMTDTFTVPIGLNVYKIVGTLTTSGNWTTNDTVLVSISAITARGDNTGQSVSASGLTSTGVTQNVKAANLTITKNSTPTNKSVIKGSVGVLAGSWQFDATNSGEDVRITALAIRASTTGKFTNLTLKDDTTVIQPVNNNPVSSNNANTTSTFALSSPIVITKGTTKIFDFYVDVPSNTNSGEVDAYGCNSGCATAYGATSGNTASVTTINNDGALLTVAAAGTLAVDQDSSLPAARLAVHGSTGTTLAEVRLKATNEAINITKLTVGIVDGGLTGTAAGTFAQVKKFYLKKDGAIVGSSTGYVPGQQNTVVNLSIGDLNVPEGTTGSKLSITGDIVDIGTNQPGTANADVKAGLGPIEASTAGSGSAYAFNAVGASSNTTATMSYTNSTGTGIILHKAVPSIVVQTPSNKLGASAVLARVQISAVGNDIGFYRTAFVTSTSTGVSITNGYTRLASCGGCGGISDGSVLSNTQSAGTFLIDGFTTWNLPVSSSQSHGKSYVLVGVGQTATVDFYATVGLTTNSDTVSTSFLGDTATTTSDTGGSEATGYSVNQQGNFVWSDLNSSTSNSSTGLASKQWYNGYLVAGLGSNVSSTPVSVGE